MSSTNNITELKVENQEPDFFEMGSKDLGTSYKTGYDKEAIAQFQRLNYVQGLNGHHEYQSANSLRYSVPPGINMNSTFDRFKVAPNGGYFATTHHNETSFKKNVSSLYSVTNIFYRLSISQKHSIKRSSHMVAHYSRES